MTSPLALVLFVFREVGIRPKMPLCGLALAFVRVESVSFVVGIHSGLTRWGGDNHLPHQTGHP